MMLNVCIAIPSSESSYEEPMKAVLRANSSSVSGGINTHLYPQRLYWVGPHRVVNPR